MQTQLAFTTDGLLPPGEYALTLDELRNSILVTGPPVLPSTAYGRPWNVAWRRQLVTNLGILARQLWAVGIDYIFVNGSFVEEKGRPNDIDGWFECDVDDYVTGRLHQALGQYDDIWTWSNADRRPDPNSTKLQLPMWHKYHVELYPELGFPTNITDQFGQPLPFSQAFRRQRMTGRPKGVIRLVR